jgi:hypothetical protein
MRAQEIHYASMTLLVSIVGLLAPLVQVALLKNYKCHCQSYGIDKFVLYGLQKV